MSASPRGTGFAWPSSQLTLLLELKSHVSCCRNPRLTPANYDVDWDCVGQLSVAVTRSLSRVRLFETPWTAAPQASLTSTLSQSLLKLMSIKSVMPSTISSSVTLFSSSLNLSQHQGLIMSQLFVGDQRIGASASASVLPMEFQFRELSGLIPFRMDWLDHLAVQRTLKNIFQHHSSKASVYISLNQNTPAY